MKKWHSIIYELDATTVSPAAKAHVSIMVKNH